MGDLLQTVMGFLGVDVDHIKEKQEEYKNGDASLAEFGATLYGAGMEAKARMTPPMMAAQGAAHAFGKARKEVGEVDGHKVYVLRGDDRLSAKDNRIAIDLNDDGKIDENEILDTEFVRKGPKDQDLDGNGKRDKRYLEATMADGRKIIIDRDGGKWRSLDDDPATLSGIY